MSDEVFSPRMRGCSERNKKKDPHQLVFPAYAGMFLGRSPMLPKTLGFPRVCGDVPQQVKGWKRHLPFSPRMRGCSRVLAASFLFQ